MTYATCTSHIEPYSNVTGPRETRSYSVASNIYKLCVIILVLKYVSLRSLLFNLRCLLLFIALLIKCTTESLIVLANNKF